MKQTTPIHILSNISRSKDNQTMKFGQLIQYNTRDIFLEKSYINQFFKLTFFLKNHAINFVSWFFYVTKKSRQKDKRRKRSLKMK